MDGVGVEGHRAVAMEWLLVTTELGHRGAQARRALAIILEAEDPNYGKDATVRESIGRETSHS